MRRNHESNSGEFERSAHFVLCPPINEVLGDVELAKQAFDLTDSQRQTLCEQVATRQELAAYTSRIIEQLPSPYLSLDEAIARGDLSPTDVAELYGRLSELLRDPTAARIVLYMPFEWLPDSTITPQSAELSEATDEFRDAYVGAWWSLLREHDMRANFDDGDMRLDIDSNPDELPRVIKAAHLVPFLLEKGMITEDDVAYIHDGTNSEVLRQSIDEAMTVYQHRHDTREAVPTDDEVTPEITQDYYAQQLEFVYAEREAAASPQRLEWLQKVAFETAAQDMAVRLARQTDSIVRASEVLGATDALLQSTGCVALGRIAENTPSPDDCARAIAILLARGSTDMQYYSITLRRLYHMGLLSEDDLMTRGVTLSRLHGELSQNLELEGDGMEPVRTYIDAVRHDPELAAILYPVVLIGGSRIKGYGDEHSDVDVTICVRPGVAEDQRDALLARALPLLGGDKPHELWLEESDTRLAVRMIESDDPFAGNDYWVHILFGAAWVGDDATIRDLQAQLYPPYFTERYYGETDMPLQPAHRQRIEDDVLLYRLLHRGYAHQYPTRELDVPRAELIDGHSAFYDSGYRQLATQLFIEKVFLPTI